MFEKIKDFIYDNPVITVFAIAIFIAVMAVLISGGINAPAGMGNE